MPDRIFGSDEDMNAHFDAVDKMSAEYAAGHYLEVTCKKCKGVWAVSLGENGEMPKGARNPLLAHAHAHNGEKLMRRIK